MKKMKLLNYILFAILLSTVASALPDFTISNINATPSSPCFGQDAVVTFTLNNMGNMDAQSVPVTVYNAGNALGTIYLDVSASSSANGIIAVPFSSNYNLNVIANPSCSITESNCNNNLAVYGAWMGNSCSSVFTDATLRRFYKSSIHDHFYTISSYHAQNALNNGYAEETGPGKVSSTWFSGSVPLYRFWNPYPNEIHYYTTLDSQILNPVVQGFVFEGIEGYMYQSQASGSTLLYHLYHPSNTDHFYTADSNEKQSAISQGFLDQGTLGYIKGADPSASDLAVYDITQQPGATGGQPAKIYAFLTNYGGSFSSNFDVQLFIDGIYVTSTVVNGLLQNEMKTAELTATVSAGQHQVTAYVSPPVNDKDTSNNQFSRHFTWAQPASQNKPAPKPASFSNTTPAKGSTLTYTYNIQAYQMDSNYRSMVHFLNDSNNIVINDDHWLSDVKGFQTNSASFSGLITYSRSVMIPNNFTGRLRMTVGFYNLSTPNVRAMLDPAYATELWYGEYQVGEVNVPGAEVGGPEIPVDEMIASFPALFRYDTAKNTNLAMALYFISKSFKENNIAVSYELLAAMTATLEKEVPGSFAPIEEGGDFGMGPGCTYKVSGACRSTPYDGGVDYKGRGYIQITHKSNYQTYCGSECIGTSSPDLDVCGCKNQWHCAVSDETTCPQIKALQPEKAGNIFALFYINHGLVAEANNNNFWQVGKIINGGDAYAGIFQSIANYNLSFFNSYKSNTDALLAILNDNPYSSIPYPGGALLKESGDPKVYVVENSKFRHIADETSYCYYYGYNFSKITVVPAGDISKYNAYGTELAAPSSYYTSPLPPPEGSLVKEACSSKVYLYTGGKYRWIVDEYTFNAMGYHFNDVITVAHNRIAQQNSFGDPIKYEPQCQLPAKHNVTFSDIDNYDKNWKDVVIGSDTLPSNPLDTLIPYNPSAASCQDFNVCNNYRGNYLHQKEGSGSHAGVDVLAPPYTTEVYAMADGVLSEDIGGNKRLVLSAYGEDKNRSECYNGFCPGYNGGYGGMVIIRHDKITLNGDPLYSVYLHMREFNPDLKVGDFVTAGTYLGTLANDWASSDNRASGFNTDPHMHFQIDRKPIPNCIDQFNQTCAWPYEPQTHTDTPDLGYLNNFTVNPLKLMNRFGYYLPSELQAYYACGSQVPAGGPDAAAMIEINAFYSGNNTAVVTWNNTPSPTYQIALSRQPDFQTNTSVITQEQSYQMQVDSAPTYVKVKSASSDWSNILAVSNTSLGNYDPINNTINKSVSPWFQSPDPEGKTCLPLQIPSMASYAYNGVVYFRFVGQGHERNFVLHESQYTDFRNFTTISCYQDNVCVFDRPNGTYYYRGRAESDCGASNWTITKQVNVVKVTLPYPSSSYTAPPVLIYPSGTLYTNHLHEVVWQRPENSQCSIMVDNSMYSGYGYFDHYGLYKDFNPGECHYIGVQCRYVAYSNIVNAQVCGPNLYADYAFENISVSGGIRPEADVSVKMTVSNIGNSFIPNLYGQFYYETDQGARSAIPYAFAGFGALYPGERITKTQTIKLRGLTEANKYLTFLPNIPFSEQNLNNNNNKALLGYVDSYKPVFRYFFVQYLKGANQDTMLSNSDYTIWFDYYDDLAINSNAKYLYQSMNGGSTWSLVGMSSASCYPYNNGETCSFTYRAPSTLTNNTYLKLIISDWKGNTNQSILGPYKIVNGSKPTVSISYPKGGEIFYQGEDITINWTAYSPAGVQKSQLYLEATGSNIITSYLINSSYTGTFTGRLPTNIGRNYTDLKIRARVTDIYGQETETYSTGYFSMLMPRMQACSRPQGYISSYSACGITILNSTITNSTLNASTIKDSTIINSNITGSNVQGVKIENAQAANNYMNYGRVSWGSSVFEGRIDLSKIQAAGDCVSTTSMLVNGSSRIKICSGSYSDTIRISSGDVFIDMNGATISGTEGISAFTGYGYDGLKEDIDGAKPEDFTRENLEAYLGAKKVFSNMTIINGNFRDSQSGINLSLVSHAEISNNNFEGVENPIFIIGTDSEIKNNMASFSGEEKGVGIFAAGIDNSVSQNTISGDYDSGINAGGLNTVISSNSVSGTKKGIGSLGVWNSITGNNVTDVRENAFIGFVLHNSTVTGNRLENNADGMLIIRGNGLNIDRNIISSSRSNALLMTNFFSSQPCSFNNNITNNLLMMQANPSIKADGEIISGDQLTNTNLFWNNIYCNTQEECDDKTAMFGRFSNPLFWRHAYNMIYEPGELRGIYSVEFGSNMLTDWDLRQMELIDGYYYFGFDSPTTLGERVLNIKYRVQGVDYDYYAGTTQGIAGEVYINGVQLGCDYIYYLGDYQAGYKVILEGDGKFSNPGSNGRLQGCDQLCSPEKLSKRVGWLPTGELYIPDSVFTGNCYSNGLLFDCPWQGKDIRLSGPFDWWQRGVQFNTQNNRGCGLTDSTMNQKFYAAELSRQQQGFSVVYNESGSDRWMDVNQCHPDVILLGQAHQIMPNSRTISPSEAACS